MNKGIWAIIGVIFLTAVFYIYDYKKSIEIDNEISGLVYSNETKLERETSINIQGTLHKKFLNRNVFLGKLNMDNDIVYDIKLLHGDNSYFGLFTSEERYLGILKTTGSILISNNLDKTWIQLDEINSKYNLNDGYVSGPAKNIEEANSIARSFVENSH
ncbi:hypothetical protein [Paenibacillus puerhi]|uniref:hypothetical protein n=1 Tax=Paenibacillus puerhi TaxID=2692622 RepID=UPI00135B739F|nr:hypothetical protein [Paenibacillus puerhi]